jgi:hypothetical protein
MNTKNDLINSFSTRIKSKDELKDLSILILNAPCNGFGDVIFAYKLSRYLKEWYPSITIKIATTKSDNFLSIGEDPDSLIQLSGLSKELQCRRFTSLVPQKSLTGFDLIFVAPLQADYDISYKDIRSLIPYSNKMNTYFFSEYNDKSSKEMDFHTGIGEGKYGLMFTKTPVSFLRNKDFLHQNGLKKNKYALCYIANTIVNMRKCYISFFEMVSKKYVDKKFMIVIPPSLIEDIENEKNKSLNKLYKYFSKIILVKKDSERIFQDLEEKNKNILYLRADILPVKNIDMMALIYNSVSDILLTGDQSITDALSCCPKKNIWYQQAPWKKDFSKKLALHLPQKYYKKKSTSCGTMTAINLKSNYSSFVKKYDFRKLAKPKITQIINMILS